MDDNLIGGRGKCRKCGEWHGNVAYHEAWECGRPNKLDGIYMEAVNKVYWEAENERRQLKFDFLGD